MDFLQYRISEDDENRRLDRVLRKFLKDKLSLSDIYKSIRKGLIKVNNQKTKENYRTQKNDIIFIDKFLLKTLEKNDDVKDDINKENSPNIPNIPNLEIIFENQYVKIINKPGNISVQKSKKDEIALDDIIKNQYQPKDKSLSFLPGPLHRLDKKTTGLLAFSNNLIGAREFSNLLQNHSITKVYLAILEGHLENNQKWIDLISKESNEKSKYNTVKVNDKYMGSKDITENQKEAITEVYPIKIGFCENKKITFAKIIIKTGRTHQIRSQCAFHGFPLLWDSAYNKNTSLTKNVDFFLHSYKIEISENNILQLPKELIAPLPKNFEKFIKKYLSLENFAL